MRKLPVIPTIFVFAAVMTMVALGIWQLQRKAEKEALLTTYAVASELPAITYPNPPVKDELPLYRRSSLNCLQVTGWRSVSGKNLAGQAGWAHIATCRTAGAEGPGAAIALGWSARPEHPIWDGGMVNGTIAPDREYLVRLVADKGQAGLETLKPPSTDEIANNHLAYAIQWFFFALAAATIYLLALRRRNSTSVDRTG